MSVTKTTTRTSHSAASTGRASSSHEAAAKPAATAKKAATKTAGAHDGVGLSEHVSAKKRAGMRASAGATPLAQGAGRAALKGHGTVIPGEFEKAQSSAKERFTRVGVDASSTSRYRKISAESDVISVRLDPPDFNLSVPTKDDPWGYVVFKIAEGADAPALAKEMAATLSKERGYTSKIEPNAKTGGVDLKVYDKKKKPAKIADRMTAEMPGLKFKGNTVFIPKLSPANDPGEAVIELGKKKVKLPLPAFEKVEDAAERIKKAVEKEGFGATIETDDWSTNVKVFQKDALTVDVHRVKKEVSKLFDAVEKYAEVSGDAMATYALRLEPAKLKELESGDPTQLKLFLLKAAHGIDNFEYELGDGKGISGKDAIKGEDVKVPDEQLAEKHLRPKDGYTWKILDKSQVYEHGLRYIFEDDGADFKAELEANANGEQENRAKLEKALHAFEASFTNLPATGFHMIRMPDQGVGSVYAVMALDSKAGVVRVVGNYGEPGGPPNGVFG